MTCIIGMYYGSGKGALVIADSRSMSGGDYSHSQKVTEVDEGIVFAAAGYAGIAEKLLPSVRDARNSQRRFMPSEVVNVFEDQMAEVYNRYKMTRPYRFGSDDSLLSGIIGFIGEDEQPELHCLYENGYAEKLHDFHAVGHGARHAKNILRTLYTPSLSKDRAIEIGIHALLEVAKIDAMVDDDPQIAVLEKDITPSGLHILDRNLAGFQYDCPDIKAIKTKLEGIEEKRTEAFHLLLDGSEEIKRKLDETLKEYHAKRQPKKARTSTTPAGETTGDGDKGAAAS